MINIYLWLALFDQKILWSVVEVMKSGNLGDLHLGCWKSVCWIALCYKVFAATIDNRTTNSYLILIQWLTSIGAKDFTWDTRSASCILDKHRKRTRWRRTFQSYTPNSNERLLRRKQFVSQCSHWWNKIRSTQLTRRCRIPNQGKSR